MQIAFTIGASSVLIASMTQSVLAQCSGNVAHAPEQIAAMGTVAGSSASMDIVDTAVAAGSFKTLAAALSAAGLVDVLKADGPYTVFAPTDAAFAKLPAGTVEMLLKPENKATLTAILTYHVVKGNWNAGQVSKLSGAGTLEGQRVNFKVVNGKVMIDNAAVSQADIACSNGVIHVIDTVIMPTNKNLVQVATEAGSFSTLLAAAQAAGLVDALNGDGPLTVLAPSDAAFAKLPAGTVDSLMLPENKQKLANLLKYHIISGRVYSDQAITLGSASTLQGQKVTIASKGGAVMIDNASVVAADIDASNGVIHVIDSVIMPK